MIAVSFEESGLDPQSFMLVRMVALATLNAAPASWLMNITVGGEAGLASEQLLGTLRSHLSLVLRAWYQQQAISSRRSHSLENLPKLKTTNNPRCAHHLESYNRLAPAAFSIPMAVAY